MNACVYINLPAATARRAAVEAGFAAAPHAGWTLRRFEALGPAAVAGMEGPLTGPEKACFASHRAAIAASLDGPGHLLVTEDDVAFTAATFPVLEGLMANMPDWDIVFADAALCDFSLMVQLARRRDELIDKGAFDLIDLRRRSWAGATAYCVRGSAKAKVLAAVEAVAAPDRPYDLFLADLVDRGVLRAAVCFPFLTTLSEAAEASQIQGDSPAAFELALNAFRRLMCVQRDPAAGRRDAERLRAACPDEAAAGVGAVFAVLSSPDVPLGR